MGYLAYQLCLDAAAVDVNMDDVRLLAAKASPRAIAATITEFPIAERDLRMLRRLSVFLTSNQQRCMVSAFVFAALQAAGMPTSHSFNAMMVCVVVFIGIEMSLRLGTVLDDPTGCWDMYRRR
jgi:hypothetical protein